MCLAEHRPKAAHQTDQEFSENQLFDESTAGEILLQIRANAHEKHHDADNDGPLARRIAEQIRRDLAQRILVRETASSHYEHREI